MFDDSRRIASYLQREPRVAVADGLHTTALLTIPKLPPTLAREVRMLDQPSRVVETLQYARAIGLLHDARYQMCKDVLALSASLTEHLAELLTIPQESQVKFGFSLTTLSEQQDRSSYERYPAGIEHWYGTDLPVFDEHIKPTDSGIAFTLKIENGHEVCLLKPSLDSWKRVWPMAEVFAAHVLRDMQAAPFIVTPWDIQNQFSENYFECGDNPFDEDEDSQSEALFNRATIETIPELWRAEYLSSQNNAVQKNYSEQASLPGIIGCSPEQLVAETIKDCAEPEAQKLYALGQRVLTLTAQREASQLRYFPDFVPDDVAYVLYYEEGDFLIGHLDSAYQDIMNSGDDPPEALIAVIKQNRTSFDLLIKDLRDHMTYVDTCAAFVELLTGKES